jgi:C_GCAxxG_C_C family probable redox protein
MRAQKTQELQKTRELNEIIARWMQEFQAGNIQCAETVLCAMAEYYGWENPMIPRVATPFGGGIAGMQRTCGAFLGGSMVIGLLMGRDRPGDDREPAVQACRALAEHIEALCGAIDCRDIVGAVDFDDPAQRAAFRAEGGKHRTVCEALVASVCRHLAERFPCAERER